MESGGFFPFGGDPEEIMRGLREFAEQQAEGVKEAQREQFATLTLSTAVELTQAALAQMQPTGGVDEQAFERVAHAGTLHLRVQHDLRRLRDIETGRRARGTIEEHVAHALVVLHDGHACVLRDEANERLTATRDRQIDMLGLLHEHPYRVAIREWEDLNGVTRKAGARDRIADDLRERRVRPRGLRPAP